MFAPDYDVVIVGAGIAGTALAASLLGNGLRVALVEANPLPVAWDAQFKGVESFDRRVSALTPASQRMLENLQVWPSIVASRACPYQHMQVWDAEGTGAIEFHAAELDTPVLGHIVENRVLTAALLARVESAAEIRLHNPARVQSLAPGGAQQPRIELEDGSQLSCSLLVGADGALSHLRKLAGFRTREWDYGHHALVCTAETEQPHRATAYQCFLSSGPLAFLPLPSVEGRHFCSIVWSVENELTERLLGLDEKEFAARLALAFEHRLGRLLAVSPRVGFPLRQRHAVDYVQPGIALVGDAAHTLHPLAGQGINLGLQDVAVLADEIDLALQRGADPGALEVLQRYQRRRKGENLLMMAAMDGLKRLFTQQQLPLRWLRNTGMNLVGRALPLKRRLMRHAMGIR
ncbi:MAG: UbiH/UbiF/VisC/COQ6 family ubiquinone biosynthesis hydroxylase [Gammaproteobacteria bacterium]|nr:UbiH/UbiF/VisC/COQ6 family ubiquinone biosynthesis hydroxylase [Gammaproteobacteria bacterium]